MSWRLSESSCLITWGGEQLRKTLGVHLLVYMHMHSHLFTSTYVYMHTHKHMRLLVFYPMLIWFLCEFKILVHPSASVPRGKWRSINIFSGSIWLFIFDRGLSRDSPCVCISVFNQFQEGVVVKDQVYRLEQPLALCATGETYWWRAGVSKGAGLGRNPAVGNMGGTLTHSSEYCHNVLMHRKAV